MKFGKFVSITLANLVEYLVQKLQVWSLSPSGSHGYVYASMRYGRSSTHQWIWHVEVRRCHGNDLCLKVKDIKENEEQRREEEDNEEQDVSESWRGE